MGSVYIPEKKDKKNWCYMLDLDVVASWGDGSVMREATFEMKLGLIQGLVSKAFLANFGLFERATFGSTFSPLGRIFSNRFSNSSRVIQELLLDGVMVATPETCLSSLREETPFLRATPSPASRLR